MLRRIGELILNWKRSPDKAFRYGGDEFAVLMPEAGGSMPSRRPSGCCVISPPTRWAKTRTRAAP